jgi:hypothetical protein
MWRTATTVVVVRQHHTTMIVAVRHITLQQL